MTSPLNDDDLFIAFRQLERKIESLKRVSEANKKRIEKLQDDNKALRQTNREQETELKELKQAPKKQSNSEKIVSKSKDFGKIVSNNLSGTDTSAELKQQLDEYIRELERCIAHLSSLS